LKDTAAPSVPAPTAGLGRRLGSLCYEALMLTAILFVAAWIFLAIDPLLPRAYARPLFQLYLLAITGTYFIYCWTRGGQSLPMKTWRIRVTAQDGTAISTPQAIRRYLFALAGTALFGAGFWWALIDRDRQFLHDRLAGTRLVMNAE
jgi:uncharacterized RDD family membrane protein YckC